MFFLLSKIFWTLAQPLNALCLLGLAGLAIRMRRKELGQGVMNAALILILILGVLPVGPLAFTWLERQYPAPKSLPERIDGIIVLGGAFESGRTKATGQLSSNDQVDRMFCFIDLAKKHPEARLVFSGGSGDITNPDDPESKDVRAFFELISFNRPVLYEEKSRNTYENAVFTRDLVSPKAGENWIVVTSAYHMPRAVGIFTKLDWPVIPFPCDPKTDGDYNVFDKLPGVNMNFALVGTFMKEIIGSVTYYVTGKSAFILP